MRLPLPLVVRSLTLSIAMFVASASVAWAADPWLVFESGDGPGKGKHVVLVSGDEEYRSEEYLSLLGKILAKHHGFKCTVLFAIDPADGTINPVVNDNIPGLEALASADLMIIAARWRDLPDEQMKHIIGFLEAGKPILVIRTGTHAFKFEKHKTYADFDWQNHDAGWDAIVGETWVSHHGHHGHQSTRGVAAAEAKDDPILRGCNDIWGPTDVYVVRIPATCRPLLNGQVLTGMKPTDPPLAGPKNDPMMPIAWTKTYTYGKGPTGRAFVTTMGASVDFVCEDLRRLIVNASYWCLGMEDQIPPRADVSIIGPFEPTPFGFAKHRRGLKPQDYGMPSEAK